MSKKAVVKKEDAQLPIPVADLEQFAGEGFEGADKDSYAVPFLRILQALSPQCVEGDPESYVDGAKPGLFYNTITQTLYEKELVLIPVHYGRSFIEWKPGRGGFVKDHGNDPSIRDRVVKTTEKNVSILDNGNELSDTRNHFVLIEGHEAEGPIIFSLSASGIKHSKKWMTVMNNLKLPGTMTTAPMFASRWKVSTVINKNDDGTWYQIGNNNGTKANFEGWVSKEQFEIAKQARELITSGNVEADWNSTVDKDDEAPNAVPVKDGDIPF
jgi:hypothetical protein